MDYDPDQTPVKTINVLDADCQSPSSILNLEHSDKTSSPAYIKWDFDLPPISEKLKCEVIELGREIKEHRVIRRRTVNRASPYSFRSKPQKPLDGSPTGSISYCRSINLLKEALGEISPSKEKTETTAETSFPRSSNQNINNKLDFDVNPDLFDDSINDFLNECSQNVEKNFYENSINKQDNNETESNANTDHIKMTRPDSRQVNPPVTDVSRVLDEVDDDLFLELDLSGLY